MRYLNFTAESLSSSLSFRFQHLSSDDSRGKNQANDSPSEDCRYSSFTNATSSTKGVTATSNYPTSSSINRLYLNSFSQNSIPGIPRSDHRRTFATIGRVGSNGLLSPANNQNRNFTKHRLGSRKMLTNRLTHHASGNEARVSDTETMSHGSATYFNSHVRRTVSASGLASNSSLSSSQGKGHHRNGSYFSITNTSATVQPFMHYCMNSTQLSSDTSTKVTAQQSTVGLSVITGPAPISYKNFSRSSGNHSGDGSLSR